MHYRSPNAKPVIADPRVGSKYGGVSSRSAFGQGLGLAFGHGALAGLFRGRLARGRAGFAFAGDRDAGNAGGHAELVSPVVVGSRWRDPRVERAPLPAGLGGVIRGELADQHAVRRMGRLVEQPGTGCTDRFGRRKVIFRAARNP